MVDLLKTFQIFSFYAVHLRNLVPEYRWNQQVRDFFEIELPEKNTNQAIAENQNDFMREEPIIKHIRVARDKYDRCIPTSKLNAW